MPNTRQPFLTIVPEDEAWASLVRGFLLAQGVNSDNIDMDRSFGGYWHVMERFEKELVPEMLRNANMHVLLLVDFDRKYERRLDQFNSLTPASIRNRAFLAGCQCEAEDFKRECGGGKWERLGQKMADFCLQNANATGIDPWTQPQIAISASEISRLKMKAASFIFS